MTDNCVPFHKIASIFDKIFEACRKKKTPQTFPWHQSFSVIATDKALFSSKKC